MVQHTVPPPDCSVIQHNFSKNQNQQATPEQDCEALEVATRFRSNCVVVCSMLPKNIFRKWKAPAAFTLQLEDGCHTNAKVHWQVLPVLKAQRQTKMLKNNITPSFLLQSRDFLKGKICEKMSTLGVFFLLIYWSLMRLPFNVLLASLYCPILSHDFIATLWFYSASPVIYVIYKLPLVLTTFAK